MTAMCEVSWFNFAVRICGGSAKPRPTFYKEAKNANRTTPTHPFSVHQQQTTWLLGLTARPTRSLVDLSSPHDCMLPFCLRRPTVSIALDHQANTSLTATPN